MKQFIFGEPFSEPLTPSSINEILKRAQLKKTELNNIPISKILELLDQFALLWVPESEYFETALAGLQKSSSFSMSELKETLGLLPEILKSSFLKARLKADLNAPTEILDHFIVKKEFETKIRAYPLGTLLHVTANNVFLSSIDSLIMGLTTKNISLSKVGSHNSFFPHYFAHCLSLFDQEKILTPYFCILEWKGGDTEIESILKQNCDGILLWGGEEMAASYRQGLAQNTKLIEFGPKLSFQLITDDGLQSIPSSQHETFFQSMIKDITRWEQKACSNAQLLFIPETISKNFIYEQLTNALTLYSASHPRPPLSDNEMVELWKESYLANYHAFELKIPIASNSTPSNFLLHFDPHWELKTSPLHRTLIIKTYQNLDDLQLQLSPWKYYWQTCGLLATPEEENQLLNVLFTSGVKRITQLGSMTDSLNGSPHDGVFPLSKLVNWVCDERPMNPQISLQLINNHAPPTTSYTYTSTGFIFASGGTTGLPKFVHYSQDELDLSATLLAKGFAAQGIKSKQRVANIFMAANMWSSFEAVNRALAFLDCEILGIGGQCPPKDALSYLKRFPVQSALGMPSQLIALAKKSKELGFTINIPSIFYAGEMMTDKKKDFLSSVFNTHFFGSAGHASVDAGPIGYQCGHCPPNVHHLFSQFVSMDIVQEEAMIQSSLRKELIGRKYATGDRVSWFDAKKICACGDRSPRYQLWGRIDQLIMIWSARIPFSTFQNVITKTLPEIDISSFQIQLKESLHNHIWSETLLWNIESTTTLNTNQIEQLKLSLYNEVSDLKLTLPFKTFAEVMTIAQYDYLHNPYVVNARTGKIPSLVDLRSQDYSAN